MIVKPDNDYLECWRVGAGSYAIGPEVVHQVQHKRGQAQLRKMVAVMKEASAYQKNSISEQDKRVKGLLKKRNEHEKKKGTGRKWVLVVAREFERDPGRTGNVMVRKAFVVLARRKA
jgi:hypothetical protein